MSRRAAICATAAFVWATGLKFAKAECPPSSEARVSVEVSIEPIKTAFDTSLKELERLALAADRQAHMPLRAVYSSKVLFNADIDTQVEQSASASSCARATSVRVRMVVGNRIIHVARELRDTTCMLQAATEHATAHARYQEQSLAAAREMIEANLRMRLREAPRPAESAVTAERALAREISAQIDADFARIDAGKTEASRTIDSPEALAKLKGECLSEQLDMSGERT